MTSFPKESRLLKPIDFNYLRRGARFANTPFLRLYYKASRLEDHQTRLGLSVSKKVGNAVQRNRVKRILREEFRNSSVRNLNLDILVVASPRLKSGWSDKEKNSSNVRESWQLGIEAIKKHV